MKTVGILTFYLNHNYGTTLQCYALKKAVKNMKDFEPYIIPHTYISSIKNGFSGNYLHSQYEERIKKFDSFLRNEIGCSESHIKTLDKSYGNKYDIYITGSDTVWNTLQTNNDASYFLDFVSINRIKIAYAPSLGVSDYSKLNHQLFSKYINLFDYLSVRESDSIPFLSQFTRKKISCVLDPTFLLDKNEYEAIEEETPINRPYILLYLVYDDSAKISYVVQFINRLARMYGMHVIHFIYNIPSYIYGDNGSSFAFSGPKEFLYYIHHANLVVTNSFHGIAMSIIYRKAFYALSRPDASSKILHLLNAMNLENRLLTPTLDLYKINFSLDYSQIENAYNELRNQSMAFLSRGLLGNKIS